MRVILLSGKQGSGKTTLSKGLSKVLHSEEIQFAYPLKVLHDNIASLVRHNPFYLDWKKTDDISYQKDGKLMQMLGDWIRDKYGDQVLIDSVKNKLKEKIDRGYPPSFVIIDDLRKKIEFDAFPKSIKIRLECEESVRKKRRGDTWRTNTKHSTEVELDDHLDKFDAIIHTDKLNEQQTLDAALKVILQLNNDAPSDSD